LAENFISNKLFEIGNLLEQNFTFGKIDNPLYRKSLLSNEAISNDIESFKRLFFETIEKQDYGLTRIMSSKPKEEIQLKNAYS
jgi:hypothetical protein